MARSKHVHLIMFGAVAIWGATFVVVKDALTDISPLLFNLLRMTLAFLVLAVAYRKHWKGLTRRAWTGGAAVGLCVATGYQFQTAGLHLTSPSKSAFITGLTVVLVPLLAAIPGLRSPGASPPQWNVWLGTLLAFAGIVLLTTPGDAAGSHSTLLTQFKSINLGDLLTLGCAFGFAMQVIVQDRFARNNARDPQLERVPFEQLTLLFVGFCSIAMAITTPLLEKSYVHLSAKLISALVITAVLATAAAFSIQSWAQQQLQPTHLALILAFEPVFAWLTSLLVLRQGLSARASLGALLILAGMCATELIRPNMQPTPQHDLPLS